MTGLWSSGHGQHVSGAEDLGLLGRVVHWRGRIDRICIRGAWQRIRPPRIIKDYSIFILAFGL